MINYEKQKWYDKNDTENQGKRIPISAAHLNIIEDGIAGACASINELETRVNETIPTAIYLTFVGNTNSDIVSAAFGKRNEDRIKGLGIALIMYSRYKGENLEFKALSDCDTLDDISKSPDALVEAINSVAIYSLIKSNNYAYELIKMHYGSYISRVLTPVGYSYTSLGESASSIDNLNIFINAINATSKPTVAHGILVEMGIFEEVVSKIGYSGMVNSKNFLNMAYNCDSLLSKIKSNTSSLHEAALSSTIAVTKAKQPGNGVWYNSPCFLVKASGNGGHAGQSAYSKISKTKSGLTLSTGTNVSEFTYAGFEAMQYIKGETSSDHNSAEVIYIPIE